MKPDWKDAPEWANYLAMDYNGVWYWYTHEPRAGVKLWWSMGREEVAEKREVSWKDSLEKRPSDSTSSVDVNR